MKYRIFSLFYITIVFVTQMAAEDGSHLWLRLPTNARAQVSAPYQSSTLDIAVEELQKAWQGAPVWLVIQKDKQLKPEGFRIRCKDNTVILSAPTEKGLLYAAYHLLRLQQTTNFPLSDSKSQLTENPVYNLRILNHWDNMDRTIERGYAGQSLWNWKELPNTLSDRYKAYARANASIGINGTVLNNVNADPKILSAEYLQKVKALADIFRPYGLRVYLSVNFASPMTLDPDYKGSEGKTENSYYQQEYYLSASALYRVLSNLSFSLSTDGSINRLNANLKDFAYPTRYSWLTAFAGKYVNDWLTASASVLATVINEEVRQGSAAANRRKLSPYVSASFKPFAGEEFRIRLFYKDIFRLPSFNDLYYGQVGNTNLKPESTTQYNLGLTYSRSINELIPYVSVTADAYYNKVKDKIIAIPTKNLFIWSMVNLGKVDIKGIDVAGNISLQPWEKLRVNLSGNYTYQRALDMTEPGGKTYKQQIAYTPRVSGSGQAGIETPWVNLSYSFLFSGKRYMLGQNLRENRLDSYSDHSISVSRDQRIRNVNTSLTVEVLNLLDKNYEIVKNFPMPGRSVRVTMKVRY